MEIHSPTRHPVLYSVAKAVGQRVSIRSALSDEQAVDVIRLCVLVGCLLEGSVVRSLEVKHHCGRDSSELLASGVNLTEYGYPAY